MQRVLAVSPLALVGLAMALASCGGGGGNGGAPPDNSGGDSGPVGTAPKVVWSLETDVKNPVTDLAACAESVMACVKDGTALGECFGKPGIACAGSTPEAGCCMPACGVALASKLAAGTSEQDAFLEVFVYDGGCMPGIAEAAKP